MAITTVWRLDMKEVKQMMVEASSLPSELIIDASEGVDVTKLKKFITVMPSFQTEIGYQTSIEDESEILQSLNELTLSVNAYGANAYAMICKIALSMKTAPLYQMQRRMRIGFLRSSQVRNLPTAISGGKEQRAQVDLIFSINNIIKSDVSTGESVQIKIEVNQ